MLKKILLLLFAFVCGYVAISLLPRANLDNLPYIVSDLIMNPVRFFIGMLAFIMTTSVLSTFVKSAYEQTLYWIMKKQQLTASVAIDYSSIFCYLLLMKKSILIAIFLLIFSLIMGVLSIERSKEVLEERGY